MKARLKEVLAVVATLSWRGFGIFLYILGGSMGVGAAVTGNWLVGVLVAWGTLMLGVISVLGYAIATTGRATSADVARGARDAIEKAKEASEKK